MADPYVYTPIAGTTTKLTKFFIVDADVEIPDVTFNYEIDPISDSDAIDATDSTMAVLPGVAGATVAPVSFNKDSASYPSVQTGDSLTLPSGMKYCKDDITIDLTGCSFTEPGTYGYRIFERKGSDKDITYDDRSYEVTVFVTSDDDGNLEYQIVLSDGSSVKPTSVKFVNTSEEDKPDITPTTKPSNPDPITRTGEVLSKYLPYGLIAIALGAGIIIFVIIRRRRDKAS